MAYNFLIIGGDKRLKFLAEKLKEDNYTIYTYGNQVNNIVEINKKEEIFNYDYNIVISSMPLTKDGVNVYTPLSEKTITINDLKTIAKNKKLFAGKIKGLIDGYDMLDDEELTILNTIPTAEGAIEIAMKETNYTLDGSKVLVMGFGRVGKTLANKLSKMGLEVYCEARKDEDLAWIKAYGYKPIELNKVKNILCKMDIIFNTVPIKILDKNMLILLNKKTLIIDLASAPGGVDFDTANKLGINAILASALPGKVAPETTAEYIKKCIYKNIEENSQ